MSSTHQEALTMIFPVSAGSEAALDDALATAGADAALGSMNFGKVDGLHFARFVVIPPAPGAGGTVQLFFLLDCDAPARTRLREIVRDGGAGLDAVLRWCDGYPAESERSAASRSDYLRRHIQPSAAVYVNTVGRTVKQIRAEATLRESVEGFLDRERDWSGKRPGEIRSAIQAFVAADGDLRWALLPAPQPSLSFRARRYLNLAFGIAIGMALVPVALVGAIPFAVQLRRLERSEPSPRVLPDDEHVRKLGEIEDLVSQNQFTAYGEIKPGRFRRYLAVGLLWAVNFGARHRFNHGNLAGVKTIHAARWVFLDGRKRMVFCSNYDGSLENYMDDFIDKVAWGLNAVFSNGAEYPRTNWLVRDGAKNELAFKSYIRAHQVPSPVWYSAYPNLTAINIENNAQVRAGLHGEMSEADAARWLRRL
ncbi:MAG: hypothetical protein ABI577_02855 [bacterium]